MKRLLPLALLLFATPILAQNVDGLIRDFNSHLPIENVQVIGKNKTILTNGDGMFTLANSKVGDQISFRIMGYETREIVIIETMIKEGIVVELKSAAIDLSTITISASRNYKLDSLALRKEFSKQFNYKALGINDMFVTINPEYRPPLALRKPNSTSAIASLNLLQVFSLIGKSKVQTSKLKETLLADEAANYVDHVFSKSKIQSITNLKGDSLEKFIQRYRPSAVEAKKMSDYEMILYIKKSYNKF